MMTNDEAIGLLTVCKPLAERASTDFPAGLPLNFKFTQQELAVLLGLASVENDPISAGPGLLNRLFKSAGLTQVDVYKLDQLSRLVFKRRRLGQNAADGQRHRQPARLF